jgi:hypothetical protein
MGLGCGAPTTDYGPLASFADHAVGLPGGVANHYSRVGQHRGRIWLRRNLQERTIGVTGVESWGYPMRSAILIISAFVFAVFISVFGGHYYVNSVSLDIAKNFRNKLDNTNDQFIVVTTKFGNHDTISVSTGRRLLGEYYLFFYSRYPLNNSPRTEFVSPKYPDNACLPNQPCRNVLDEISYFNNNDACVIYGNIWWRVSIWGIFGGDCNRSFSYVNLSPLNLSPLMLIVTLIVIFTVILVITKMR